MKKNISMFGKQYKVVDLQESLGTTAFVFDLITAIEFIIDSSSFGKRVLGGDIVKMDKEKPYYCYDNWYSESESIEESQVIALNYLKDYLAVNPIVDWLVSVTI